MTDTPAAEIPRPPLRVDVSFDLDAYLSTWTHHGTYNHHGEIEEGHTAHPYPFVEVVTDRTAAALADKVIADASWKMGEIRKDVSTKVAELVEARVEAEVSRLVEERLTPTDSYGRALGPETSIEERIIKIATAALDQPETTRGRSATGRSRFDAVVANAVEARVHDVVTRIVEDRLTVDTIAEHLSESAIRRVMLDALDRKD